MTRWLTLDHAYDAAFAALPHANHEEWFQQCFGTADFLDVALRAAGHEAKTLVQNFFATNADMMDAVADYKPDVILSREAGRWSGRSLKAMFPQCKIICTCSHRVDDAAITGFDCVFSSFSWFPKHCRSIGVRCEWLPLAFGKRIADAIPDPEERDIPVAFFGGLGSHIWKHGTAAMNGMAEGYEGFRWWGYKAGTLPSALERTWQGEIWGRDYLTLLKRTKICLNRTGEIARGEGNNMRTFEIPGCGAWMVTDNAGEMRGFCDEYRDTAEMQQLVRRRLSSDPFPEGLAARAQREVLAHHCYENRIPSFTEIVESI